MPNTLTGTNVNVAAGASFGVGSTLTNTTATVNVNNLTLTTSATNPTLAFNLNGNPTGTTPLITVNGTLTTGSATNIAVANGATQLTPGSTITLIQYTGSIAGTGFSSFTSGTLTLPNRVTGQLDNSTPQQVNLINIQSDYLHWAGYDAVGMAASSIWDISTTANPPGYNNSSGTQNWRLNSNSGATTYEQISTPGDTVVFDDLPATLGGSFTVNLTTSLQPNVVTVNAVNNYTFMGAGNLSGTMQLIKTNTGTLVLANTGGNNYSGGTMVSAGTLQGGAANAFSPNSAVTLSGSSTLDLGGFSQAINALSSSSATTSVTNNNSGGAGAGNAVLTVNNGGTFAGQIQNGGFTTGLTVAGGTLILTGTSNTYSGLTTTNAGGTLQIGDGTNTGSLPAAAIANDNGTLAFKPGSGGTTFASAIGGTGGVTALGANTIILTGTNTYGGTTTVGDGTQATTLQIGNGSTPGALPGNVTINASATLVLNPGLSGLTYGSAIATISGAGAVSLVGPTSITFNGANTYTGGTTIPMGVTLNYGTHNALPGGVSTSVQLAQYYQPEQFQRPDWWVERRRLR